MRNKGLLAVCILLSLSLVSCLRTAESDTANNETAPELTTDEILDIVGFREDTSKIPLDAEAETVVEETDTLEDFRDELLEEILSDEPLYETIEDEDESLEENENTTEASEAEDDNSGDAEASASVGEYTTTPVDEADLPFDPNAPDYYSPVTQTDTDNTQKSDNNAVGNNAGWNNPLQSNANDTASDANQTWQQWDAWNADTQSEQQTANTWETEQSTAQTDTQTWYNDGDDGYDWNYSETESSDDSAEENRYEWDDWNGYSSTDNGNNNRESQSQDVDDSGYNDSDFVYEWDNYSSGDSAGGSDGMSDSSDSETHDGTVDSFDGFDWNNTDTGSSNEVFESPNLPVIPIDDSEEDFDEEDFDYYEW